jgi:DNA repair exonuclease SbcCD nuclease subunit
MVAEAASRIAAHCPLVVVGGNHDGAVVVGDATSHTLGWLAAVRMPGVCVATEPEHFNLSGWSVWAQPYPHPRSLDEEVAGSIGERQAAVSDATAERARRWGSAGGIYVGHLSVAGATLGAERTMRAGWDVTIPADALAGFDLAVLGHLHAQQRLRLNAWYCGSPSRWDWSEEGQRKGALVADVERGQVPRVRVVESPAHPIRTLDVAYRPGEPGDPLPSLHGTIVRLRVLADRRPEPAWRARLEREAYAAGAQFVRVDVTVRAPQTHESGPTTTVGPMDRLRDWLERHGGADEATLALAREIMEKE